MKKYKLKASSQASMFEIILAIEDLSDKVQLTYSHKQHIIKAVNKYPFFALVQIRLELEKEGIFIQCNGSRRNVYPSGMSAIGFKAYELTFGKPSNRLVDIFAPSKNSNDIVTVEEQQQFWKDWVTSVTGRIPITGNDVGNGFN